MFEFEAEVIVWRGPAPFYFAKTPVDVTREIEASAGHLSYGWGCIPVDANVGDTSFYTALIPREGRYLVPLKAVVRKAEAFELGNKIRLKIKVRS